MFCAVCTSERGPFVKKPWGRRDGLVNVCPDCTAGDPEPNVEEAPLPTPQRAISVQQAKRQPRKTANEQRRQQKNKALGRCINHPLTNRAAPHPPPKPGYVRCPPCIEIHAGSR